MTENTYLTTLNTRGFLYEETLIVAGLLHEGKTFEAILETLLEENRFQLHSQDRTVRFFNEIQKRLEQMDVYLFNQFLVTDAETSKAILFYALLKKDQLLFEWMREVVWDKFLVLDWHLSKKETSAFIEKKAKENETVAQWTTDTKQLLGEAYHRVLNTVGMGKTDGDDIELQRLNIDPHIRQYMIERKEQRVVEVVLGELAG
ncbi:Putative inner membrane protein [Alkalibacterium subtropicum]|uniref:Putative inner membrane protein n=1 Tax=Alkalibacterium subtropicum TaxID=753702 RepID=A0A1I1ILF6_9LACT|nr:DUF1819 family protein [Alkalibacterium subtropicum]SFC35068.1 Putative inner membrane protein [Alkalibacterium subtropicum]